MSKAITFLYLLYSMSSYCQQADSAQVTRGMEGKWLSGDELQQLEFRSDGTFEHYFNLRRKLGKKYNESFDSESRDCGLWYVAGSGTQLVQYNVFIKMGNDTLTTCDSTGCKIKIYSTPHTSSIAKLTANLLVLQNTIVRDDTTLKFLVMASLWSKKTAEAEKYKRALERSKKEGPITFVERTTYRKVKEYPVTPYYLKPEEIEVDISNKTVKELQIKNDTSTETRFVNFALELFLKGERINPVLLKDDMRSFIGVSAEIMPDTTNPPIQFNMASIHYEHFKERSQWGTEGLSTLRFAYMVDGLQEEIDVYLRSDSIRKWDPYYMNLERHPSSEWKYSRFYNSDGLSTVISDGIYNGYMRKNGNFIVRVSVIKPDRKNDRVKNDYETEVTVFIIDEDKGNAYGRKF